MKAKKSTRRYLCLEDQVVATGIPGVIRHEIEKHGYVKLGNINRYAAGLSGKGSKPLVEEQPEPELPSRLVEGGRLREAKSPDVRRWKFKCEDCSKTFPNPQALKIHRHYKHGGPPMPGMTIWSKVKPVKKAVVVMDEAPTEIKRPKLTLPARAEENLRKAEQMRQPVTGYDLMKFAETMGERMAEAAAKIYQPLLREALASSKIDTGGTKTQIVEKRRRGPHRPYSEWNITNVAACEICGKRYRPQNMQLHSSMEHGTPLPWWVASKARMAYVKRWPTGMIQPKP